MRAPRRLTAPLLTAGAAVVLSLGVLTGGVTSAAGPTAVGLGTATGFAILAGAGITNTGTTTINGDVGSFPTTTQTGFASVALNGTNHGGDAVTQGAKTDLVTAYNDAAARTPATTIPTELGGTIIAPGVYRAASGTFGLTGTVTLNGGGDSTSVFIFQMPTTLTTATGSIVSLSGGAQACNVFWQVGSSATLGGSTTFRGSILALSSITLVTGATVDGRLLARDGAVTLDTNTIAKSTCAAVPTAAPATATPIATATPTPSPVATATPTATPTPSPIPTATPTIAPPVTVVATPFPSPANVVTLPSTSTGGSDGSTGELLTLAAALMLGALLMGARAWRHRDDPAS